MQSQNNKQEFFTLDTRITIQRGNIYHKRFKDQSEGIMYRYLMLVAFVLVVYLTIIEVQTEGAYFEIIRIPIFAIVLTPVFKRIYQTVFIKTWKTIIPLKDVKNITTKPLENGLETEVTLHLQNGRKKFYTFRNGEGQMEPFIEAVSVHDTSNAHVAL